MTFDCKWYLEELISEQMYIRMWAFLKKVVFFNFNYASCIRKQDGEVLSSNFQEFIYLLFFYRSGLSVRSLSKECYCIGTDYLVKESIFTLHFNLDIICIYSKTDEHKYFVMRMVISKILIFFYNLFLECTYK